MDVLETLTSKLYKHNLLFIQSNKPSGRFCAPSKKVFFCYYNFFFMCYEVFIWCNSNLLLFVRNSVSVNVCYWIAVENVQC